MNIERETKLIASPELRLPRLAGLGAGVSTAPLAERHLDAVYYDTGGLDLARQEITLRYRSDESGPPWTLKLPEGSAGPALVRREVSVDGAPGTVPPSLRDLVRAYVRFRRLAPVARLRTERCPWEVRDESGARLAEVVDDRVTVYEHRRRTGEFREVEVELLASGRRAERVVKAVVDDLVAAGCRSDPAVPKLVRALGERALEPPELVVAPIGRDASVRELVQHALGLSVTQLMRHDSGITLAEDPEHVHQFRVGTRRLRSDLRTFGSLLDPGPVPAWRDGLSWLGNAVGAVRDTDVRGAGLQKQAMDLPDVDHGGVEALLAHLGDEAASSTVTMLAALRSRRYLSLLDALVAAACDPPFLPERADEAGRRARRTAAALVRPPWRHLTQAVTTLESHPSDRALHRVRILAKRCRYAAEAVAPVADPTVARFAAAVADLQTVLGDHQDAVVAEAWLRDAAERVPAGAVAAGELIALQREQRARLRSEWMAAWKKASGTRLCSWIRT